MPEAAYPTGGDLFEAYWRTLLVDCRMHPAERLSLEIIEEYGKLFANWRHYLDVDVASEDDRLSSEEMDKMGQRHREAYETAQKLRVIKSLRIVMKNWQFAELSGGLFAMVPSSKISDKGGHACVNDCIVVLDGAKVPLAVRRKEPASEHKGEEWEVLGTTFVHGFMDGRVMEWVDEGRLQWNAIRLV